MNITLLLSQIAFVTLPMGSVIPGSNLMCRDAVGLYEQVSKVIYICDKKEHSKWQKEFVKYHEVGHYVWFNKLNDRQRKQYTKEYEKALKEEGSFYREYSKENVLEDFADNFTLLMMNERQVYKIQRRINLIKKF